MANPGLVFAKPDGKGSHRHPTNMIASYRRARSCTTLASLTTLLCSIVACLTVGACTLLVPLPEVPTVRIVLPETAVADDVTVTSVQVQVDTSIAAAKRVVALTSTAGQFVGEVSGLVPDESGRVIALLRAPTDSTIAVVRATVNGISASGAIVYQRARAERIELVAEHVSLAAGLANEIKIVATLRRTVGIPSPGGVVTFSATTADQQPVGSFLPASTIADGEGTAVVRFISAHTSVRGRVDIRAKSDTAIGSTSIEVVAP
jgi:hypothetical protein